MFDRENTQIHHLDAVCARVWSYSDGVRTLREVAALATDGDEQMTWLALGRLESAGLLNGPLAERASSEAGSRRRFLRNAVAAVAIPTIVSITAPAAAGAISTTCEQGATRPDPEVCYGYFTCDRGAWVYRECDLGFVWDADAQMCFEADRALCGTS